jgi:hypothetical protein
VGESAAMHLAFLFTLDEPVANPTHESRHLHHQVLACKIITFVNKSSAIIKILIITVLLGKIAPLSSYTHLSFIFRLK